MPHTNTRPRTVPLKFVLSCTLSCVQSIAYCKEQTRHQGPDTGLSEDVEFCSTHQAYLQRLAYLRQSKANLFGSAAKMTYDFANIEWKSLRAVVSTIRLCGQHAHDKEDSWEIAESLSNYSLCRWPGTYLPRLQAPGWGSWGYPRIIHPKDELKEWRKYRKNASEDWAQKAIEYVQKWEADLELYKEEQYLRPSQWPHSYFETFRRHRP